MSGIHLTYDDYKLMKSQPVFEDIRFDNISPRMIRTALQQGFCIFEGRTEVRLQLANLNNTQWSISYLNGKNILIPSQRVLADNAPTFGRWGLFIDGDDLELLPISPTCMHDYNLKAGVATPKISKGDVAVPADCWQQVFIPYKEGSVFTVADMYYLLTCGASIHGKSEDYMRLDRTDVYNSRCRVVDSVRIPQTKLDRLNTAIKSTDLALSRSQAKCTTLESKVESLLSAQTELNALKRTHKELIAENKTLSDEVSDNAQAIVALQSELSDRIDQHKEGIYNLTADCKAYTDKLTRTITELRNGASTTTETESKLDVEEQTSDGEFEWKEPEDPNIMQEYYSKTKMKNAPVDDQTMHNVLSGKLLQDHLTNGNQKKESSK